MPSEPDIRRLLAYGGPNLRQTQPIEDGFVLIAYRDSDDNARNISSLLSSQGIPFRIERAEIGWKGRGLRLKLTVPRGCRRRALTVLSAAVRAGAVEEVGGFTDLLSR